MRVTPTACALLLSDSFSTMFICTIIALIFSARNILFWFCRALNTFGKISNDLVKDWSRSSVSHCVTDTLLWLCQRTATAVSNTFSSCHLKD